MRVEENRLTGSAEELKKRNIYQMIQDYVFRGGDEPEFRPEETATVQGIYVNILQNKIKPEGRSKRGKKARLSVIGEMLDQALDLPRDRSMTAREARAAFREDRRR